MVYKMTDFDIVKNYMDTKYSGKPYAMRNGNNCVWVSMGLVDMYFILRDSKIVDIQVD
jgi:hypothetical protein